jgi:hypothetical protein
MLHKQPRRLLNKSAGDFNFVFAATLLACAAGVSACQEKPCSDSDVECNPLATLLYTPFCSYPKSQERLDQFAYPASTAMDPTGSVVSRGTPFIAARVQPGTQRWIVRAGANSGTSWSTVDDYIYPAGNNARPADIAAAPDGSVYVAGVGNDAGSNDRWIVRRSIDGGLTWQTIDDFQLATANNSEATAVHVDAAGVVYAAGAGTDGVTNYWIVRKSVDGGNSFFTVDMLAATAPKPRRIATHGARVYVAGRLDTASPAYTLRLSADQGASWTNFDSFTPPGATSTEITSLIADDTLLLVGGYVDLGAGSSGFVRTSFDGGQSYNPINDFAEQAFARSLGGARLRDAGASLLGAGFVGPTASDIQATLRRSRNNGLSWNLGVRARIDGVNISSFAYPSLNSGGDIFIPAIAVYAGTTNLLVFRISCL